MGAYCRYCDHRCFVLRVIPGEEGLGAICLATCSAGMEHDRRVVGYDHTTAINPSTGLPGGSRERIGA